MLFVTLLSPKSKGMEVVNYLKELKGAGNIKIRDVFFTFGRYDGVILFEAPTEEEAMKFVMKIGFETQYAVETLVALPANRL